MSESDETTGVIRRKTVRPANFATNLTSPGDEPNQKAAPTPTGIFGGDMISPGRTELKFIAICGSQFSWD